jgi:hypothetical protein
VCVCVWDMLHAHTAQNKFPDAHTESEILYVCMYGFQMRTLNSEMLCVCMVCGAGSCQGPQGMRCQGESLGG